MRASFLGLGRSLGRLIAVRAAVLRSVLFVTALGWPLSAGANNGTHEVQKGEHLWGIAQMYGCSADELRVRNGLEQDAVLSVGVRLDVSKCKSSAPAVSKRGQENSKQVVVVGKGDTLSAIASRHGTSVSQLRQLNGLSSTMIRVGQKLKVPGNARKNVHVIPGQSVGRPTKGALKDAARLDRDPHWYRRRLDRTYAAQHVIDHLHGAIRSVYSRRPKLHRLAIGDLSHRAGGWLSGHASHQSGRDADLGLFYRRIPAEYPKEFVKATDKSLNVGATWDLVRALVDTAHKPGGVEKIFLDYELQGVLYEYARKRGVSKAKLKQVFQYPDGRYAKHGIVRHEPKHDDHVHVRFKCPADDDTCR